jgi:Excalibur calcium-binding domain
MKNIAVLLILAALGWYAYSQYEERKRGARAPAIPTAVSPAPSAPTVEIPTAVSPKPLTQFKCDGRTMCSQMTSCAEATYFLRNCPNTKMDGDNDGVPCETQWCK